MLCNRAGTWNAYPVQIGVAETGPNKLTTVTIEYSLVQELKGEEFVDVTAEGLTLTGYHYLERTDGQLNERTIKALREALGWDGVKVEWLQSTDLSSHAVTVVTGMETYNGRERCKVQWLNPLGQMGGGSGVEKADASGIRAIDNKLGAKLRAISGGVSKPAPKPAGKPTPPPPAAKKLPAADVAAPPPCSREDAWAECVSIHGDAAGDKWPELLAECKIDDETTATDADWGRVRALAPVPF